LAAVDGRILAVGTTDEIKSYVGPGTRVVDLEGRLAVPGFIDGHVHFIDGSFELLEVNLKDARDEAEFVRRIAEKARSVIATCSTPQRASPRACSPGATTSRSPESPFSLLRAFTT